MASELATLAANVAREQARHSDEGYRGAVDNRSAMVDVYLSYAGRLPTDPNQTGQRWCGMFVYWCYGQAAMRLNATNPLPRTTFGGGELWTWANAPRHRDWIVWLPGQDYPMLEEGDVFVVANRSHVGMVAQQSSGGAAFTSVEGNQTDPAHTNWGNRGIRVKRNVSLNNCAIVIRVPNGS